MITGQARLQGTLKNIQKGNDFLVGKQMGVCIIFIWGLMERTIAEGWKIQGTLVTLGLSSTFCS